MKHYLRVDLVIDGSIQDNLIMKKSELTLLSEALGCAVVDLDGNDRLPMLKLMKKIDTLLDSWSYELKGR